MFSMNHRQGWPKSRPFLLTLSFLFAVVLLTSMQVGFSAADEDERPYPVITLPEEALSAPIAITRELDGQVSEQTKMDWVRLPINGNAMDRPCLISASLHMLCRWMRMMSA